MVVQEVNEAVIQAVLSQLDELSVKMVVGGAGAPETLQVLAAIEKTTREAGRAPLAVREPTGRDSAPALRAGRLPEDDCAGLRSREWVAGRLKWGRDATGFPLETGLRAAAVRGGWASEALRAGAWMGSAASFCFSTTGSGNSSSCSSARRKYAEAGMDALA